MTLNIFFEVSISSEQAQRIQELINNLRNQNNEFENREKNYNEMLEKILAKLQIPFKKDNNIEQKFDLLLKFSEEINEISIAENKCLKKENEALKENKKENEILKKENEELKKENDKLKDKNAKLLTENQNLWQINTNLQNKNTRQKEIIHIATQHIHVSLENFVVDYKREDPLDVKQKKF
ncbi:hypothetical protein F8M41_023296 [Gigaspora margarita]|uniref:Uncharacterized protein n=1 Tax=Gigaspora margarita TaxID=4874 RepID=A0A8H4B0Y2_GIGMA|nr:hypothetical protein F8M41_023296 [Gigaspora margarita]